MKTRKFIHESRVLKAAVFSRILLLILIVFWRALLSPYDTSAPLNPKCLIDSLQQQHNSSDDSIIGSKIESSIVWDSVYFVRIAQCGYEYEQTYAFLPLLPAFIRLLSSTVFAPLVGAIGYRAVLALSGYVVSNVAFILAAVYFYRLSSIILKDPESALRASILFCYNPASIFYSSVYTESLYALFSVGGLYYFLSGANITAILWLALSGCARSNGVLNAGYICYQAMHRAYDAVFLKKRVFLAIQVLIFGALSCICIFIPFIGFQVYGYRNICLGRDLDETRPWCMKRVPLLYNFIQSHYWGVGFLRYFQFKQIPNFLLASPILSLALCSIIHYVKSQPGFVLSLGFQTPNDGKKLTDMSSSLETIPKSNSNIQGDQNLRHRKQLREGGNPTILPEAYGSSGYLSTSILPFILHLCFMAATAFFVMHVQTGFENFVSSMVEQTTAVESLTVGMSTTTSPATGSSGGPKVSKLAAKSGFVIPKNKLSGSLVPVLRGAKKPGSKETTNDENTEKFHRKTKWGADPTQDVTVRRARALAYQTRIDQITEQLGLGNLEAMDNQDSDFAFEDHGLRESSSPQVDRETLERLEVEKREAISEMLKLNPSYKTPPGYKPVLKETTVPIPVKEYQGYNFLGLIFGPASDTHKRLEKETGAIIQVCGKKADTGEKVEISPSNGNDQGAYEDLYIHISAETYEKVDAAADLIELLVTSVSESLRSISKSTLVSGEIVNHLSQSPDHRAVLNQGLAPPVTGTAQAPLPQGQFQYQNSWFPSGLSRTPIHPLNSSAPIHTNLVHPQLSPLNPMSVSSLFGARPGLAPGFSPILQNPPAGPASSQPFPMQVPPNPYMSHIAPPAPPKSFPTSASGLPPFSGIQTPPVGVAPGGRSLIPPQPQNVSGVLPRSDRPSSNMGQLGHLMNPQLGPRPGFSPGPASYLSRPGTPQSSSTALNRPGGPVFASVPHHQMGPTLVTPPITAAPRPQQPSSGDFTFRPLGPQNPALPVISGQSGQLEPLPRPMSQLPPVQPPSFRMGGQNAGVPPVPHVLPRPNTVMGQNPFGGNPNPAFGNVRQLTPPNPGSQMGPRNFSLGPQVPNMGGPPNFRPGNPLHTQHNYRAPTNRPENHMGPNQQFNMNRPFMSNIRAPSSRGSQIYDPFSPTSDF